jgi:hypothetical protein
MGPLQELSCRLGLFQAISNGQYTHRCRDEVPRRDYGCALRPRKPGIRPWRSWAGSTEASPVRSPSLVAADGRLTPDRSDSACPFLKGGKR